LRYLWCFAAVEVVPDHDANLPGEERAYRRGNTDQDRDAVPLNGGRVGQAFELGGAPFGVWFYKGCGFWGCRALSAIPQHPNHLQVIIDIRYQYAIMASLSRHDSSVLCEQWAPATWFF
jgi:hypothetical protein